MRRRPLFWFYIFVAYIAVQFIWWIVLFFRLLSGANIEPEEYQAKIWMLVGEGGVFLIIMFLGIIQVRRTFKKDRALNHLQKNFLLAVGHELKTPLTSAKIRMQTLQKHQLGDEQKDQVVAGAHEDIDRLNNLVDKILLATRIEKDSFAINKEEFNIEELLSKRVQFWQEYYPNRIHLKSNLHLNTLYSDPTAVVSIFDNLTENAAKYSENNVTIKITNDDQYFILCVQDDGEGISAESKEAIFEMFYRGKNEEIRSAKGSGLGLYIVKNLVQSLSGKIEMEQLSPGTMFTIKIPIKTDR